MSTYARQLVQRFRDGVNVKENPLEIIRFSPDILKLGLTNDELFDYCRRSARFLLAKKHPDSSPGEGVASAIALRYSDAFDQLSNREVFDRAITEFREIHSYVRSEERTLHVQLANLRRNAESLTNALDGAQKKLADEKKWREGIERSFFGNVLRITPGDGTVGIGECSKLTVLTFGIVFASKPGNMDALSLAQAAYEELRRVQKADDRERRAVTGDSPQNGRARLLLQSEQAMDFSKVVHVNRLTAMPVSFFMEQVKQSGCKLPVVRWSYARALHNLGFSKAASLESKDYGSIVSEGHGIRDSKDARRYRRMVNQLLEYFYGEHIFELSIVPQNLSVRHRMLDEDGLNPSGLYILGTVELFAGVSRIDTGTHGPPRVKVPRTILRETVPVLAPGRIIVT
ncbi:MAG: hypothetical protein Greene041614_647, partial [Parcubacteria group bacterium Greene0416_14]